MADLLFRMEAAGDDRAALRSLIEERIPDLSVVTIQNAGEQARLAFRQERSPGEITDPQLDVEAMECLHAWLIGRDTGEASISPQATLEAPGGESAAPIACAGAVAVPLTAEIAPEAMNPVAEEGGGATTGGSAVPSAPPPKRPADCRQPYPAQSENATRGRTDAATVEADPFAVTASSPILAPPKGDLLVTLAREFEASAPVRSIDVTANGNVASAVVLVVTPAATGTGVLLDYAGHVLANRHVVRAYPGVSISFKTQSGAAPSSARTRSATVVRLGKTSDLALLKIDNPPRGITPVRVVKTNEIRNG